MKKEEIFDNHIKDYDELINQLESLKKDAMLNMKDLGGEIFQKDFHALKIAIKIIKEMAK